MSILLQQAGGLSLFILTLVVVPTASYGAKTDAELLEQWEKEQAANKQAPGLLGKAWEKAEDTAGFLGPVFNAGGSVGDTGGELGKLSKKGSKALIRGKVKGSKINDAARALQKNVHRAGEALEKAGKAGAMADDVGNLAEAAGALYEGDFVGVGQTAANASLSGAAASAGGWALGEAGLVAGTAMGGPLGGLVVGTLSAIGGAVMGSVAYDEFGRPIVKQSADAVEGARSDWEAGERNRLGRIRADIHAIGGDEALDPSSTSAASSSTTAGPAEVDPLDPHRVSAEEARVLREMADRERARRQAEKAAEEETRQKAEQQATDRTMARYLHDKARRADERTTRAMGELGRILNSAEAGSDAGRRRIDQLLGEIAANQAEMDKIAGLASAQLSEGDSELYGPIMALVGNHPDPAAVREMARRMIETAQRQAAAQTAETDGAGAGWGEGSAGDDGWGQGGYARVSPAEQYVNAILAADAECDYRRALDLAERGRELDPDHAWLNQNYPTIRQLAERGQTYRSAIQAAIDSLEKGKVGESIVSLKLAMQHASVSCGQDEAVRSLLEEARRIARLEREEAIEQARREGERSAMQRVLDRERFEQRRAERERSAEALQGALMGVLGVVNQVQTSRTRVQQPAADDADDMFKRMARENERKYGGMMERYRQSQTSFTAPKTPVPAPVSGIGGTTPGWETESTRSVPSSTSSGADPWEGDYSSPCDGKAPGVYEFGECFEDRRF